MPSGPLPSVGVALLCLGHHDFLSLPGIGDALGIAALSVGADRLKHRAVLAERGDGLASGLIALLVVGVRVLLHVLVVGRAVSLLLREWQRRDVIGQVWRRHALGIVVGIVGRGAPRVAKARLVALVSIFTIGTGQPWLSVGHALPGLAHPLNI